MTKNILNTRDVSDNILIYLKYLQFIPAFLALHRLQGFLAPRVFHSIFDMGMGFANEVTIRYTYYVLNVPQMPSVQAFHVICNQGGEVGGPSESLSGTEPEYFCQAQT